MTLLLIVWPSVPLKTPEEQQDLKIYSLSGPFWNSIQELTLHPIRQLQ